MSYVLIDPDDFRPPSTCRLKLYRRWVRTMVSDPTLRRRLDPPRVKRLADKRTLQHRLAAVERMADAIEACQFGRESWQT